MPTEVIMPKVDMDMEAGTVAVWYATDGQNVTKGDALFDIETDKATMEIESPQTGVLRFVTAKEGDQVAVGNTVAWIFTEGEVQTAPDGKPDNVPCAQENTDASDPVSKIQQGGETGMKGKHRSSPLARRLAATNNIDLATVSGSGPRGRIVRADIEKAMASDAGNGVAAQPPVPRSDPRKIADALGLEYTEIEVDRMRSVIAARLTESKTTVPHFYLETECRIDALLALRTQLNNVVAIAEADRKISLNDLLVRACALALRAVPEANASWAGDSIIRYASANISVAVAVEGGLLTPVVRDAQDKDVQTISEEIADLAGRAKAGKLAKREYQGGSFSVSNLGMYGIKSFQAIVNPPESMIMAVGQGQKQVVVGENGQPETATIMCVNLSCDHRVVDGVVGARWLSHFQTCIENPAALLLGFRSL